MPELQERAVARVSEPGAVPRAPREAEMPALRDWLDAGLRDGVAGSLVAEYPISMRAGPGRHRVVFAGDAPAAHAMWHVVHVAARGCTLPVALIGNVYTDPAHRRRGLASVCVEACVAEVRQRGVPLALLWSGEHDFYARLGFHPVGRETYTSFDAPLLERVASARGVGMEVGPASRADWVFLEAMYAEKPQHVVREAGALAELAAAPRCRLVVARSAGRPVAYAAAGRGRDMAGCVHEWAGDPDGVVACLDRLHRDVGAAMMLSGPTCETVVSRLHEAGAEVQRGCFALGRILDAVALWSAIAPGEGRIALRDRGGRPTLCTKDTSRALNDRQALELLFGEGALAISADAGAPDTDFLAQQLPWPLYLWGFDSI